VQGVSTPFPDYSFYSTAHLIEAFAAGPSRLRASLAGLSEDDLRARPRGPGSWSIQEIVVHTADSELQGTYRIKKTWAEPSQRWPVYDQDRWTSSMGYQDLGPPARENALALLELLRVQSSSLFKRASDEDWAKHGEHPEMGRMTLRNLLEMYADHVERHIDQIRDIRQRLGKPLQIESLLLRRLF
jgi:hypothetical protein